MLSPRVLAAGALGLLAVAGTVVATAGPAAAQVDCDLPNPPPICTHEPPPSPSPTGRISGPTSSIVYVPAWGEDQLTISYSAPGAARTTLERCNQIWREDDPRAGCTVGSWTTVATGTGGGTVSYSEEFYIYNAEYFRVTSYNARGGVVDSRSFYEG